MQEPWWTSCLGYNTRHSGLPACECKRMLKVILRICIAHRKALSSGLEQQTKQKRATGPGRTAARGTSPNGAIDCSRMIIKERTAMVSTVRCYMASNQNSAMTWRDGTMLHATGGSFTLSAKSQSAQVLSLSKLFIF